MYTLLSDLFTKYCGYPQYNLAILGLQRTGKTQILKALKDENSTYMVGLKQTQYKQTIGLNTTQLSKSKMNYLVWDLGGKTSIRKIWESYFPFCHGLVYIFDDRLTEGFQCLKYILQHQQMAQIPALIYVRSSQFYSKIRQQLNKLVGTDCMFNRIVVIQLLPHSRERLYEHLQQLYQNIRKIDLSFRR